MDKIEMPFFENEAAEAQWWYDNREEHAKHWVAAIRKGHVGEGSIARGERRTIEAERLKATPKNALDFALPPRMTVSGSLMFYVAVDESKPTIEYKFIKFNEPTKLVPYLLRRLRACA